MQPNVHLRLSSSFCTSYKGVVSCSPRCDFIPKPWRSTTKKRRRRRSNLLGWSSPNLSYLGPSLSQPRKTKAETASSNPCRSRRSPRATAGSRRGIGTACNGGLVVGSIVPLDVVGDLVLRAIRSPRIHQLAGLALPHRNLRRPYCQYLRFLAPHPPTNPSRSKPRSPTTFRLRDSLGTCGHLQ